MSDDKKRYEIGDEDLQSVTGGAVDWQGLISSSANAIYLTCIALYKNKILAAIAALPDSDYATEKPYLYAAVEAGSLSEAISQVQNIALDRIDAFFEAHPEVAEAYGEAMIYWIGLLIEAKSKKEQ